MHDNEGIIVEFVAAWSQLDPVRLASYFTEDGCYYNMPFQPVRGRKATDNLLRSFRKPGLRPLGTSFKSAVRLTYFANDLIADRLGDVDLPCVGYL